MSIELLPCPFCGHERPSFEREGTPRQSCIVVCGNCGCRHESSDEDERSGSSWNDRAAAPKVEREGLTDAQVLDGYVSVDVAPTDEPLSIFEEGVRFAERSLGIAPSHGERKE